MQHKLLRHAQLTKEIQLEIQIHDAEHDGIMFHQKVAFFPLASKFALFQPTEDEWHGFAGPRQIIESVKLIDDKDYHLLVTPRAPEDVDTFKFESVGEQVILSGADLKRQLRKVLKAYQLYSSIEYEK